MPYCLHLNKGPANKMSFGIGITSLLLFSQGYCTLKSMLIIFGFEEHK